MSNITIIDDALPEQLFDKIRESVFSLDFPWYYSNTAYSNTIDQPSIDGYSYAHTSIANAEHNGPFSYILESALLVLADKAGQKIKHIERARMGQIGYRPTPLVHPAHIDYDVPHWVGLLYLNDSDGDTVIYDQRYEIEFIGKKNIHQRYLEIKDNLTVLKSITPKKNRFVSFDGYHYHSSTTPTQVDRRVVINFNYEIFS